MILKTPSSEFPLAGRAQTLLGRGEECDLILDDPQVSRRHARIESSGSTWRVCDMESANGTSLNGRPLTPGEWATIIPGAELMLGTYRVLVLPCKPASAGTLLQARNVIVEVGGHRLLDDVTLAIPQGALVGLIGPSGAGKTTLLLTLNGYTSPTSGEIRLGGLPLDSDPAERRHLGYVPQDDLVPRALTVGQALESAAALRLPAGSSPEHKAKRIEIVLGQLQLKDRRDVRIGLLSGGERKRVNIAVELLAEPALLFLDEPTTGLDAALERRVTGILRDLTTAGTTVVCVTHATATLDAYDLVAAMAPGGTLVAFGSPSQVRERLGARGDATLLERAARAERFLTSEAGPPVALPSALPAIGPVAQFTAFWSRGGQLLLADGKYLALAALQMPALALLLQALFRHDIFADPTVTDANGRPSIQDAPQVLFLLALAATCFPLFSAARELVRDRALLARERHLGLSVGASTLARVLLLTLISTVQAGLLVGFLHPFLSLPNPLVLAGTLALASLAATLLGLVVSALSTSLEQATTSAAGLFLGQVILSGLVPLERLGVVLRSLSNLTPLHWCYGALCGIIRLAKRWEDAGIGSLLHKTLQTEVSTALGALTGLCVASAVTLLAALSLRAQKDRMRHA
ncbi:MAG: ATP-binding cassette domain-containing protein [Armatimonas sp.]